MVDETMAPVGVDLEAFALTIERTLRSRLVRCGGGGVRVLEEFDEAQMIAAIPSVWGQSISFGVSGSPWMQVDMRRGVFTVSTGIAGDVEVLMSVTLAEAVGLVMRRRAAEPVKARERDLASVARAVEAAASRAENACRWLSDPSHPAHEAALADRAAYEARRDAEVAEHQALVADMAAFAASPLPGSSAYAPSCPTLF